MTKFYTFNSEQEAEAFCTQGCPIYGKDLEGNEVRDKGVTTRLADWVKHPSAEKWLVNTGHMPEGTEGVVEDFDHDLIYPPKLIMPI